MGIGAYYIMKHVTETRINQWLLYALPIPFKHVLSIVLLTILTVLSFKVARLCNIINFNTLTVAKGYKTKRICV